MKHWSKLHIATHILAILPLIVLVIAYYNGYLGINPIQMAQQRTGDIAIVILLLSLACTPLNTIFKIPELLKLRRPLGLYAFFYATLHLLAYTGWDYSFDFPQIYASIADKPYMIAGISAILLMVPLTITSHVWWQKKLRKGWKKLHTLVYFAAGAAVLHLAWVVKGNLLALRGNIWKPLLAVIALTIFMVMRIPAVRKTLSGVGQRFVRRFRGPFRKATPVREKLA